VAKEYRGRIDFVWIEGGAQPELEAALNLGFGNLSDVRTSLVYLPTQRDRKKKRNALSGPMIFSYHTYLSERQKHA
jgi:hypothetical protein